MYEYGKYKTEGIASVCGGGPMHYQEYVLGQGSGGNGYPYTFTTVADPLDILKGRRTTPLLLLSSFSRNHPPRQGLTILAQRPLPPSL